MDEVTISEDDYQKGFKVCDKCQKKVHVLRPGCESAHELCMKCGYSVVDIVAFEEERGDRVEGWYGS